MRGGGGIQYQVLRDGNRIREVGPTAEYERFSFLHIFGVVLPRGRLRVIGYHSDGKFACRLSS